MVCLTPIIGVNPGGLGVATPRSWAGGCEWRRGPWTGRKILYLVMYRKVVTLKRNRITCPEIAVNSQFLPGKLKFFWNLPWKIDFLWNCLKKIKIFGNFPRESKFFVKLPEKIEIFRKFALKIDFCLWNCLKKWKFRKIEIFWPVSTMTPQISNQIDAADSNVKKCT